MDDGSDESGAIEPYFFKKEKNIEQLSFFLVYYDEIATITRVERLIASKSAINAITIFENKMKIAEQPYFFLSDLDFDLPKKLYQTFQERDL